MSRYRLDLGLSTYIGVHLVVVSLLSWATGTPFLLPSLGPSAFALATSDIPDIRRRVVGGQIVGVFVAFISVRLLLGNVNPDVIEPLSLLGIRQIAATFLSVILATAGMHVTRTEHPPAYATVLIVALGIIDSALAIPVFVFGVLLMVGTHTVLGGRFGVWDPPYEWPGG